MTNAFQNALLATAAAAVLFALPMAGAAEAGPRNSAKEHGFVESERGARNWGRNHSFRDDERGPVRYAARRDRSDLHTPVINQRIANQADRIEAGVRTGGLTRFEAMRLGARLMAIRAALRLARVDGDVTPSERRKLLGMLNENSQRIARLRHNGRFN